MYVQILRVVRRQTTKHGWYPVKPGTPINPFTGKAVGGETAPRITSAEVSAWLNKKYGDDQTPTQIEVPFEMELTEAEDNKTVLELKTRFYKWHTDKIQKPKWPKPVKHALSPITCIYNPPGFVDPTNTIAADVWYAVYYKSYFVRVEQNTRNSIFGPHAAKLYIEVGRGKHRHHAWLGTTQFGFPFASEAKLRVLLKRSIRLREFYTSEASEEEVINLNDFSTSGSMV